MKFDTDGLEQDEKLNVLKQCLAIIGHHIDKRASEKAEADTQAGKLPASAWRDKLWM
jgi:hypothetical protein